MGANFLSLPTAVVTNIWDYCGAKEIMALTCTCRTFHTEIESFMLVVDAYIDNSCRSEMVPIFFADQCHSVFMICEAHHTLRMKLLSRNRQHNGEFDTRIWGRKCRREVEYYIAFRNDPSRQYLLQDDQRLDDTEYMMTLRKQFMKSAVTPAMKGAISTCLNLGNYKSIDCDWKDDLTESEWTRFHMKLFVFGCMSLPEESSPVRKCFRYQRTSRHLDNATICLFQKQIINLFEQTLEQKEPIDCVKRALSSEELERESRHPAEDVGEEDATFALQSLDLRMEFTWKRSKRSLLQKLKTCGEKMALTFSMLGEFCDSIIFRRYPIQRPGRQEIDQEEGKLYNDDLVFIARIPLAPEVTRITLLASIETDSSRLLFVIFFQKRLNGLDNLENSMDGKVFTVEGKNLKSEHDLNPEYEACFLYFVPDKTTTIELKYISVVLEVVLDDYNRHLWYWMSDFNSGWSRTGYHDIVPIVLLRDGALALIKGADQELCRAWDTFFMRSLDLTPEGLANLVDVCTVLLQGEAHIWH